MKTALIDLNKAPELGLDEIGAEIHTHYPGLGQVKVMLDDCDFLTVNSRLVIPFLHHYQSRGLLVSCSEILSFLNAHNLINATLCGFLWRNPSFIPRHWLNQLDINGIGNPEAGGGIIFWGTTVNQFSGTLGLPVLQQLNGQPQVSIISFERVISLKASAVLV